MGERPVYLSTDPQAGKEPSKDVYLSMSPSEGSSDLQEPKRTWLDSLKDYVSEASTGLNPVTLAKGAGQIVSNLGGVAQTALQNQAAVETKAEEAFKRGDYAEGVRHTLHYLLPLIGPRLDQAGDYMQQGQYAKGLGATTDVALQTMGPKIAQNALSVVGARIPAVAANTRAPEVAAAQFAEQNQIPISAAAASGNKALQGVQALADRSIGGSLVATRAEQASANRMATVGEQLASKGYPTAVSPEQAGQGVIDATRGTIAQLHGEANTAYDAVRAAEADPKNLQTITIKQPTSGPNGQPLLTKTGQPFTIDTQQQMPLPVDLRDVRAALKPIYDRVTRLYPIAQREASRGYQALGNVVNGPDYAPLSEADDNLSAIKSIARGADMPELRSTSQGMAATAVDKMDAAVRQTAAKAGVLNDLMKGRAATVAKYQAADVLDGLQQEPVRAFNQTTYAKDAGIGQLRTIAKVAPDELPKIGRAYLDDLLTKATSGGGFDKGGTIANQWENLGPQTKLMIFKDPAYIADLDNYFRLSKMRAQNPNPSGSGYMAMLGAQGYQLITNPVSGIPAQIGIGALSKLLHSPTGVRLLTRGFSIPVADKAASMAWTGALLNAAGGDLGLAPVSVPALAGSERR
jgi:hypothetical protein